MTVPKGIPMSDYTKINNYTLGEVTKLPDGDATLTRLFNFASGTITTIFRENAKISEKQREYSSGSGYSVSNAAAASVTSQMQIQKFSELDSLREVEILHQELVKLEGTPPALSDILNTAMELRKDISVGRSIQLKPGRP